MKLFLRVSMSVQENELPQLLPLIEKLVAATSESLSEGLDPSGAAAYLGISTSTFHGLNAKGMIPAPAPISDRCPRWSRTELKAWLLAGAPMRSRWNHMRDVKLRAVG